MNQIAEVVFFSLGMFVVTFSLGYAPTKVPAPERVMKLISLFGACLLVGAALIVIVPEGMSVLYKALSNFHGKHNHSDVITEE
jgi:hypothetical protein